MTVYTHCGFPVAALIMRLCFSRVRWDFCVFDWHRPIKNSHFTWFLHLDPNWRTYVLHWKTFNQLKKHLNITQWCAFLLRWWWVYFHWWWRCVGVYVSCHDSHVCVCVCCCHFRTDRRKRSYPGNISLRVFVSHICVTPLLGHQKEKVTLKSKSHSPSSRASLCGWLPL